MQSSVRESRLGSSASPLTVSNAETDLSQEMRWLAPESLRDAEFTHKSDVWAMGVVIYEVWFGLYVVILTQTNSFLVDHEFCAVALWFHEPTRNHQRSY